MPVIGSAGRVKLLRCGRRQLELAGPLVMGVLNVTPDSFSDGGRHASLEAAVARGRTMVEEGAAIIDVGGESTRPGAQPVTLDEELRRVIPVIERLSALPALISIDTRHARTMSEAVAAGAGLINDVAALREPGALEAAAASGAAVCVMHMQGEPRTMQTAPRYEDVVGDVEAFLRARVACCLAAGIGAESLLVDPGFGFGKTLEHNLALLRALPRLAGLGFPLLVGLSRKAMIGALTGRPAGQRLAGSLALALCAAQQGAAVLRVHDVAETVDVLKVWAAARAS